MPVQYSGIMDEHLTVRSAVGIFDVSHMGEIEISGPDAFDLCQKLTANDITRIGPGQAQYSLLLNENGGVVDDVMVYRMEGEVVLLCVNASNRSKDFQWIQNHREGNTQVLDKSDDTVLLALQGPRAPQVLQPLTAFPLDELKPFCYFIGDVAGGSALVSRTGYTGEDGFELYCEPTHGPKLWNELWEVGKETGLKPVGLGARDTLRLERALPLYGHELDDQTTPLEAGLGWVTRLSKGDFLGRDALVKQKQEGIRRKLVGLELLEPGIARGGHQIIKDGRPVGQVTSGTKSPTLKKAIGLGYVSVEEAETGNPIEVEVRGRKIKGRVVKLPFYRR